MDNAVIFDMIRERFRALKGVRDLLFCRDTITVRPLSPGEILGSAERTDFPVLGGKEYLQQAEFCGGRGQAFTSRPVERTMTLDELLALEPDSLEAQGLCIAGINAVMNELGLAKNTVHCRDDGPECCARGAASALREELGDVRLALIGYQPCLFANLSAAFPRMRVTDLGPDRIGTEHYGITVEDGVASRKSVCDWADVILCTGSTLTNGTFPAFYGYALEGRDIRFYGTTIAGAAVLLGLRRLCSADLNGRRSV